MAPSGQDCITLLLGHAKAWEGAQIDQACGDLTACWEAARALGYTTKAPIVVSGRDEHRRRGRTAGSWDRWIAQVCTGTDLYGAPYYDALVVCDPTAGRATAQLIRGFLQAGKPVLYWDERREYEKGRSFCKVIGVQGDAWTGNAVMVERR
jgi:hypothetical protein